MSLNLARMKKQDIVWLATHKCKAHGNKYIEHPNCFVSEHPETQKVGFIDLEASNLKADFGLVICVSILDMDEKEAYNRCLTPEEVFHTSLDKPLLKDVIQEMRKYDRLIGYYASNGRFDIPFLRARSLHHNLDFPGYGEIVMEDVYPYVRYKLALSRNRLETACEFIVGNSDKTRWSGKHWVRAIQGNKDSLDYIVTHCNNDVKDLRKLYKKLYKFSRKQNTSL